MLQKSLQVRASSVTADNQYDVFYADITADWELALQGVYDFLGQPFRPDTRIAMQAWQDSNRQHQHGAHKYSLTDFGLDPEEVEQRLMFYRKRFNIPFEVNNPHLVTPTN